MPAFFKCKKFIVCAVATILAAIAAIIAVSFTYAAYRNEIIGSGGANVAGAIADYSRGTVYRNNTEITYKEADNGGITISELSPGDILTYNFSVNAFRRDGENIEFNEVLLRITCEFSFTYAYIEGNATQPVTSSLSAVEIEGDPSTYTDDVDGVITFRQSANGVDYNSINAVSGTETVYYDREKANSSWQVNQQETQSGYVQKLGFYLYPVSSESEEGASQSLGFMVMIPAQEGSSEDSTQFRLTVNMKITAEQVLDTAAGTTG